jgi:hypothetical protein
MVTVISRMRNVVAVAVLGNAGLRPYPSTTDHGNTEWDGPRESTDDRRTIVSM